MTNSASLSGVDASPPVRLDTAVDRVLAGPVDNADRAELERMQDVLASREVVAEGLDPPSLTGALFAFLMPRLINPSVLRLARRQLLLGRIAARCADESDPVVLGSLLALRHELANLSLLRSGHDGLIGE